LVLLKKPVRTRGKLADFFVMHQIKSWQSATSNYRHARGKLYVTGTLARAPVFQTEQAGKA
jgi:hypothetical protein